METIVSQMGDMLVQIVASIVIAIVGALAIQVKTAYIRKMDQARASGKNQLLLDAVDQIVRAVEQQITAFDASADKLAAADAALKDYADKFRIPLTADERRTLIESAVYGLRQAQGEV